MNRETSAQRLARRVAYLMSLHSLSEEALGKLAGVSGKSINNARHAKHAVNLTTLDGLSRAFGISAWVLLAEGIPNEMLESSALAELPQQYVHASDEGRALISQLAAREAFHAKNPALI